MASQRVKTLTVRRLLLYMILSYRLIFANVILKWVGKTERSFEMV